MAKTGVDLGKVCGMRSISAKEAKYGFGRLIDLARLEPIVVEKHGRAVVVVLAVEEYERLRNSANGAGVHQKKAGAKRGRTERG